MAVVCFYIPLVEVTGGISGRCSVFFVLGPCSANLDKISGAAVNVDVRQLQTDDLSGLSNQEGSAG